MPKAHLRLLLKVLFEKLNHSAAITLDCPVEITQTFMSNGQIEICPMNQFDAHISRKVYFT